MFAVPSYSLQESTDRDFENDEVESEDQVESDNELYQTKSSTVTKVKLLTAAEEVRLSREYKLSRIIQDRLQSFVAKHGRSASETEVETMFNTTGENLLYLLQRGEEAKEKLMDSNMRLVYYVCNNYKSSGVPWEDLVLDGSMGLNKAIEKFDAEKGFRFGTYATWWVKMTINQGAAMKSEKSNRLPVHMMELVKTLSTCELNFRSEFGRDPTPSEIAYRMAIPIKKVHQLLANRCKMGNVDEVMYQRDKSGGASTSKRTLADSIASFASNPSSKQLQQGMAKEVLVNCLSCLEDKEEYIIRHRYGLAGQVKPKPISVMAREFGVHRNVIRAMQLGALAKIKQYYQTQYQSSSVGKEEGRSGEYFGEAAYGIGSSSDSLIPTNSDELKLLPLLRD